MNVVLLRSAVYKKESHNNATQEKQEENGNVRELVALIVYYKIQIVITNVYLLLFLFELIRCRPFLSHFVLLRHGDIADR